MKPSPSRQRQKRFDCFKKTLLFKSDAVLKDAVLSASVRKVRVNQSSKQASKQAFKHSSIQASKRRHSDSGFQAKAFKNRLSGSDFQAPAFRRRNFSRNWGVSEECSFTKISRRQNLK
jgi:hypothetical protein